MHFEHDILNMYAMLSWFLKLSIIYKEINLNQNRILNIIIYICCVLLFFPSLIPARETHASPTWYNPTQALILENRSIRITFDHADGLPNQYDLLKFNDHFLGGDKNRKIEAVIRKLADHSEKRVDVILSGVKMQPEMANFRYQLTFDHAPVGTFEIHYTLDHSTIFITIENVSESKEFHLIEVITGNLVTIMQKDGPSSFVYNNQAGKLVSLAEAQPGGIGEDTGAFGGYPNISVLPVVALIKPRSVCTMEVQGFCNKTVLDVTRIGKNTQASIGVFTPYYQRGGLSAPDLIIHQNKICRIDFAGDYDGNGTINWLDAAKMVSDYLPGIPTHFYDDKFLWIIQGQVGRHPVEATFDEVSQLISRVSALTDNNPQICYISGWCKGGHDTGYPNVQQLNPLLGDEAAYITLRDEAKKRYNTTVSFDDNYDDQYLNEFTTGVFDEDNIAKTADGKHMKFNAWNGQDSSYITGMAHYMRPGGPGEARVDYTATRYGLQSTLLIDAATWWTIRPDYDPNHPAGAPTNLIDGKFRLFDRYQKRYGINITSELLRYPAVGHIAMVCDGPDSQGGNQYGGAGTDIPFLAVAYHKSIYYGCPGGIPGPNRISEMLYNNNIRHGWLTKNVADSIITNIYFTNYVPWFKIHNLDILSFKRNGTTIDMELSQNSSIHLSPESVTAKYQGNIIIRNDDITCPIDDHRITFYSKYNKTLSYPLPAGTDESAVKAMALYSGRRENVPVSFIDGLITIHCTKQVPVIVYY